MRSASRWIAVVGLMALASTSAALGASASAPKHLPRSRQHSLALGRGRIGGSSWAVLAAPTGAGRAPGHAGCISAIAYAPPSNPIEKTACGSLLGPTKPGRLPLLALAGNSTGAANGHPFDGSVLGMAVASRVTKLTLRLPPHRTLTVPTKLLTSRQADQLNLERFRYVALALPEGVCVEHVTGTDKKGATIFSAAGGECATSPSEKKPSSSLGAPPTAELLESPLPAAGTAALRGAINPGGLSTTYSFEWGTSEAYENRTPNPDGNAGAGISPTPVEAQIGGLKGKTTYFYRLVGQNGKGSAEASGSLTTPAWRPTVTAEPPTGVSAHAATLNAKINAQGFGTHYRFEWGASKSYGRKFEPPTELTQGTNVGVSFAIGELEGNTEYYYRVVAESSEGFGESNGTFLTSPSQNKRIQGAWELKSSPDPGGLEAQGSRIEGVSCASSSSCAAVGEYQDKSGHTQAFAERLGQSGWELVATPEVSETEALKAVSCDSPSDCMAVGHYLVGSNPAPLVEHWNGSAWSLWSPFPPNPGLGAELTGVSCRAPDECTAAGSYEATPTLVQTLALRWNGSAWSRETTPNSFGGGSSYLTGVSCNAFLVLGLFERECLASGYATNVTGASEALAERWDGKQWEMLTIPRREGEAKSTFFTGISCPPSTECMAIGYLENTAGKDLAMADRWTGFFGRLWEMEQPPGPNGAKLTRLNGASCTDTRGLECMAVGEYQTSSGEYQPFADQWFTEEGWALSATPEPAGSKAGSLNGVACAEVGECVAGGYVENSSGVDVTLAEIFHISG